MIENLNYIQANEAINGENGAPGELDVANRPLKELINLFNTGNANTQVRRINFKIPASQMITDGIISDNVVSFDNITGKYVKTNWQDKKALGIIDIENLTIYSFGEYKLKNITNLIPGKAYFLSQLNDGEYVDQDSQYTSATHIGVAITNDTIEINKYIDATFASVQINDVTPSFINTYSSNRIEELLNTRATKIYFFSTSSNVNSLAPAPTSVLNIPLNSAIVDLNIKRLYYKVSNSGLTSTSTLANAISSNAVISTSVSWSSVTEKPDFATVATSGSYNDLSNKPQVATATVDGLLSASDKAKLNSIDLQTQAVPNSTVKRGTDGSIQAGGSSTFNIINGNTITQPSSDSSTKLASTAYVNTVIDLKSVSKTSKQALNLTEAITVSGTSLYLNKADNTNESVNIGGTLWNQSGTGYQILPSGLVLQWGTAYGANISVIFPITFNTVLGIYPSVRGDGGDTNSSGTVATVSFNNLTNSSVSIYSSRESEGDDVFHWANSTVYWFAIGI